MTASPTAIPRAESSAHHKPTTPPPGPSSCNSFSRSPPKTLISPIYTSAGRSAFSLPGPNSTSTSPTTTSWYSAGFASNNSQRVRSPSSNFGASNGVTPQRDVFMDSANSPPPAHYRTASFGSASRSSSISSADLMNEPTTPKATEGGMPLGRVPSIPLNGSYEQMKGHRGSWSAATGNGGWTGFNNLRGTAANSPPSNGVDNGNIPSSNGHRGSMSGLLRQFSFGSATTAHPRVASTTAMSAPAPACAIDDSPSLPPTVETPTRGRQASLGGGPMQKRRPSPMGERLLMGHFNAH